MKNKIFIPDNKEKSYPKCPHCKKNSYSGKFEAELVKKNIYKERGNINLKIYKCPYNNVYHLSSSKEFDFDNDNTVLVKQYLIGGY
ncbi:MAG TPA: hypothetical protein PK771_07490 [Spirochaetota bacterium]|nr:hypothetical protein [Spirochaetota bacterium]